MRYNVIGRVVNECSRIESYSVGEQVLVSEKTLEKLQCAYDRGDAYDIKAKGVKTSIKAYEVTGISGEYKIKLKSNRDYNTYIPQEEIVVELYSIIDKKVSEKSFKGVIKCMSDKRIILECEDSSLFVNHSDYKVTGVDKTGRVLFLDVYAKSLIRDDGSMHLLLTYVDGSYTAVMDEIKKGKSI